MSKLFKNNDLNNIFTESSFDFPSHATIVDINNKTPLVQNKSSKTNNLSKTNKFLGANAFSGANTFSGANNFSATSEDGLQNGGAFSETSSNNMTQNGGAFSETSSNNMTQNGGAFSATSSNMMTQNGGAFSETSYNNMTQNGGAFSATSSNMMTQNGGAFSATSSNNMTQNGGAFSATSSNMRIQNGGAFSATSSNMMTNIVKQSGGNNNNGDKDVDALLAMLTSDNNLSDSENTNSIEAELRNVLNTQAGGNNDLERLPNIFINDIFSEVNHNSLESNLSGGGTRFIIDKDLEIDQNGGAKGTKNGLGAFIKLKKFVSDKLKISNGVPAAKIAGAVLREVKGKYENISSEDAVEKAMKHLEKNIEKFKKML